MDNVKVLWPMLCGADAYQPFGRFAHFIDPALRAVLETSLLPDDNDLFLSNLAHTPVLAIHGCV
jgi:hypothetical protein